MVELVKEGKAKCLGLSECSEETLRRAYKVCFIAAVQAGYSQRETNIKTNGLLKTYQELGVGVAAYSPVGKSFLTDKSEVNKLRKGGFRNSGNPQFTSENINHNIQLFKKFKAIAQTKNTKASHLCFSWALAQINISTRRSKSLEESEQIRKLVKSMPKGNAMPLIIGEMASIDK
ncbi:Aldo/keto reductase [Neoconidiobolus thromboides FSU 785]|nr:Aldo/keto reductase [Neoconidiobolus thromboides FSU 785]